MKVRIVWAEVDELTGFRAWWPQICKKFKWPENLATEKWAGQEMVWAKFLDSFRSYTLFEAKKVLIIQNAEKAIKKYKKKEELFELLKKGPHCIVLQSTEPAPSEWPGDLWKPKVKESDLPKDEKAIFRWIDSIDRSDAKNALLELEKALLNADHPLVCLQVLTRHFRLGRLLHHAIDKGLTDKEIITYVKVPSFVIQKWRRRGRNNSKSWNYIFDRLHRADLDLKSGLDSQWCLRKISLDLIDLQKKKKAQFSRSPQQRARQLFKQPLWKVAPSFR